MSKYLIGVIVGSIRKDSLNRQLANALIKLGPSDFTFNHIEISDLPMYNQDLDGKQPDVVGKFKQQISQSQGLIFVTPEYNRSISGVLKNALDQGSRPYGQSAWAGKPCGVVGVSVGTLGTALAQQHLRNILAYLDAPTLGQPEAFIQAKEGLFDAAGNIGDQNRQFFQTWMDKYAAWVKTNI